jgi:hypothetical protein
MKTYQSGLCLRVAPALFHLGQRLVVPLRSSFGMPSTVLSPISCRPPDHLLSPMGLSCCLSAPWSNVTFFFHRHRASAFAESLTLLPYSGNQAFADEVMMPLMRALVAVLLRQLDAIAFDLVASADMNAVNADDFHVLFDLGHCVSSVRGNNAPERQTFTERRRR